MEQEVEFAVDWVIVSLVDRIRLENMFIQIWKVFENIPLIEPWWDISGGMWVRCESWYCEEEEFLGRKYEREDQYHRIRSWTHTRRHISHCVRWHFSAVWIYRDLSWKWREVRMTNLEDLTSSSALLVHVHRSDMESTRINTFEYKHRNVSTYSIWNRWWWRISNLEILQQSEKEDE